MRHIVARHRHVWTQNAYIKSFVLGLLFLLASLVINYFAGQYANSSASNSVTDIILDHLPIVNVDFLFIDGFGLFLIFVITLLVYNPKQFPFLLKALAILIAVRSFFITLTHLAPVSIMNSSDIGRIGSKLTFNGDLFFSAHTGIPFLFALIFWQHKILRWVFVGFSIFFAVVVLLGHVHYSIDVFAAYFITYTIYIIATRLFPSDLKNFNDPIVP